VTKEAGLAKFEKSVEGTIPALRRYARALTQDSEIADDLVHNTLLQAIRSKRRFHGGVVLVWLYAILTDLNSDRLRLLARQPTFSPSRSDFSSDVTEPDAGGSDIQSALSALVDDQRTALLLVVLEGLTYREVAEVQGVSISIVTARLAAARGAIKNVLEGDIAAHSLAAALQPEQQESVMVVPQEPPARPSDVCTPSPPASSAVGRIAEINAKRHYVRF
jgi:RNA polymerase sigma-70 factor, ECF subfamily